VQSAPRDRYKEANKVLEIVSQHGRRFFWSPVFERRAYFGLDRHGQIWYCDEHSGLKIHPFGDQDWPGFTNGSTLKYLVQKLAHYIKTGECVPLSQFPYENDDRRWAYGESEMHKVRAAVLETEAITGE
jgi:hypothetical protein